MRRPRVRFAVALLALALPWLGVSCATVYARGIVKDARGEPIGNASVRVTSAETGQLVMNTVTDAAGCFIMHDFAGSRGRHFRLDVGVPGYKSATFRFDLQTPVLLGTLAAESSARESLLKPLTNEQAYAQWELICAPPSPVGN